jgi:hypothetical protein
MTMVVVMASQHEVIKLRDDGQTVNSKDSIHIIGFRNAGNAIDAEHSDPG